MTQRSAYVDPASLSLPSSSIKRPVSPASSVDDSAPRPSTEPPRKRPRSAITPEERKEARAHRNRIAAQNSRDRRKAQYAYLERRVAELEDENRRLRAGLHVTPCSSPSISALSEPDATNIEREQEQLRKRQEEQRERENQELRERIRTLEKGYEVVVRALTAQGNPSVTSSIPTPPATTPDPSHSQSSSQPASNPESSKTPPPSSTAISLSSAPSIPLSPSSPESTLVNSPLFFSSSDSFDFPPSPALPATEPCLALPENQQYPHSPPSTGGEHCRPFSGVPAAGGRYTDGDGTGEHSTMLGSYQTEPEDEAASDAAITRLFAEILASPTLSSGTLPSSSTSSEDALGKEMLTNTEPSPFDEGLGLDTGMNGIDTVDWVGQVRAEIEMEKLLGMLPNVQDVAIDAVPHSDVNLDADMDFSSALMWDGVSVF